MHAGWTALRNERLVAFASLLAVAAVAWLWLLNEAARMSAMPAMPGMPGMPNHAMAAPDPWNPTALALTLVMWTVMMVGMMLPSAAPAIVLYGTMVRKGRDKGSLLPPVWLFAAGYLAVWTGFSLCAALLQSTLQSAGLISPMLASVKPWLTGGLLMVAGAYQLSPLKASCLRNCRSPLALLMFHRREGRIGIFATGLIHGIYCVGCCWALMLLLFSAGVMNLVWVALITCFILAEKIAPAGAAVGRLAGLGMMAVGLVEMLQTGGLN